ncbi:MAG: glycoside hydrolase, partial [Thermoplasmata archaeon]|nr:glycoside hydrolase [Thermoplasmata archaeon]
MVGAPTVRAMAHPGSSYQESGWSQFFTSVPLPNPTVGNNTCLGYGGSTNCWNSTVEPSMNLTSDGYTGLAYTAFTNESPCPAMRSGAVSEIGFAVSTSFGTSWTAPTYLGNPVCAGDPDQNYSSAAEPSLTSLGNGTLVLTYLEFNASTPYPSYVDAPPVGFQCGFVHSARVVVTESFDHGRTWTIPKNIDGTENNPSNLSCPRANFPDLRPRIAAWGDTLYLTWFNGTSMPGTGAPRDSAWVFFVRSTDGGATWSTKQHLTVVDSTSSGIPTDLAINPTVGVDRVGNLFVAYGTDFGSTQVCLTTCNTYPTSDIEVARSSDNGTTFAYAVAVPQLLAGQPTGFSQSDPDPVLAFNPISGDVYLAYTALAYGSFCLNYATGLDSCSEAGLEKVFFTNSSDAGVTWSTPRLASAVDASAPWFSPEANPSMAVDGEGKIHLQYATMDDAIAQPNGPYGLAWAAPVEERYVNSSDDGSTWSPPLRIVYDNTPNQFPYWPAWPGSYTSTLAAGREVLLGWTQFECPPYTTVTCGLPSYSAGPALPPLRMQVIASRLYTAPGLTLTFNESGLPNGLDWSVDVDGNLRNGPSGANLSISGVPPSSPINWSASWVNQSYGVVYTATPSVLPPTGFTGKRTVVESYQEQVLVNLLTLPSGYPSYFFTTNSYANVNLGPSPGSHWVSVGTTQTFSAGSVAYDPYCFACLNLTFESWEGIGSGSRTSNATSITFTPTGPVNETAVLQLNGICWSVYWAPFGFPPCIDYNFSIGFEESGLPSGAPWGVTTVDAVGTSDSETSSTAVLSFPVGSGPVDFVPWTVPDPATGSFWIPSSSTSSPIAVPVSGSVPITYALGPVSGATFATRFEESG